MPVPSPVAASIKVQKAPLRRFATPYYEVSCDNCLWSSFLYATPQEAEYAGDSHAERCCARINAELAQQVPVTSVAVQDLAHGQRVLLKDLRTMDIQNIEVFDDEVMVTYSIAGLESQILMLPLGHAVKVVED